MMTLMMFKQTSKFSTRVAVIRNYHREFVSVIPKNGSTHRACRFGGSKLSGYMYKILARQAQIGNGAVDS